MKTWKTMLIANAVLLAGLLAVSGPLGPTLQAQFEPRMSPCCKTAIEGNPFCCADCCGSGNRCTICDRKKK